MKSTTRIEERQLRVVQLDCNKKQESLRLKVEELEYMRRKCWLMFDSLCDMWNLEEEVKNDLSESAAANFKLEMLKCQFGDNSSLKHHVENVLVKMRNDSELFQEQLTHSMPSVVPQLVSDIGIEEALSLEEIQDQWKYFEFSSTNENKVAPSASVMYNSIGDILPVSPKPSSYPGKHTFASNIQNANVMLKAKLLKVNINRPWFTESLFHDSEFKLVGK